MYIEAIRDEGACVGCGNCEKVCPTGAVKMQPDSKGFLNPSVDHDRCVSCGKCERCCPTEGIKYSPQETLPDSVIIQNTQKVELDNSASGGLCSLLASYFINTLHGFVCGAVYHENFEVRHIVTDSEADIERMRGSKYVQSDLRDCFARVKALLGENKPVLFIGTTCQVYALIKFLNGKPSNLFCVDLICHGVPSPLVQREYVKYLTDKYGELTGMNNRYKRHYPHSYVSVYSATTKKGKTYTGRYSDDPMADAFFSHLSVRDSCFNCRFKTVRRMSDLTAGDFWFSEKFGMGEDLYGVNLCLIQSEAGRKLLEAIGDRITSHPIDTKTAVLLNGGMIYGSCPKNKNREKFFEELGKTDFLTLVRKYDGIGKKMRIKYYLREGIAPVLRRTKYYNVRLSKNAEGRLKRKLPEDKCALTCYD